MPPPLLRIGGRYELGELIATGGMGRVYKAFDTRIRREVALKTVNDVGGPAALDMFLEEWRILAALHHPNIVEIYDVGDFQEDGRTKPFFVMPLMRGVTLDKLIQERERQLPFDRLAEIVTQICAGLRAIHERSLVHRDIKPNNIFILEHNSVKLIDFGIAHLTRAKPNTIARGTAWYMAPEQIEHTPPSPQSDIFSLGVLCYEALTGVLPFEGATTDEILEAVRKRYPVPASEINPAVGTNISRVVHKALAKQPQYRFATAAEFADAFQKALRNETIESLDPARLRPHLQRAIRAFEQGEMQLASDVLQDLETCGYVDAEIVPLRERVNRALTANTIRDLLSRTAASIRAGDLRLSLQYVDKVLRLDAMHEEARDLREKVQRELTRREVTECIRTAEASVAAYAFSRAKQIGERARALDPENPAVGALLRTIETKELEYEKSRIQKDLHYRAAREAAASFEFGAAIDHMDEVLRLEQSSPETSPTKSRDTYATIRAQLESAREAMHHAFAATREHIAANHWKQAAEVVKEALLRFPRHPLFLAVQFEIEERKASRQALDLAAGIVKAASEPVLETRAAMLADLRAQFPGMPSCDSWARACASRAGVAHDVIARAHEREAQGRLPEATEQWATLKALLDPQTGAAPELETLKSKIEGASAALAATDPTAAPRACDQVCGEVSPPPVDQPPPPKRKASPIKATARIRIARLPAWSFFSSVRGGATHPAAITAMAALLTIATGALLRNAVRILEPAPPPAPARLIIRGLQGASLSIAGRELTWIVEPASEFDLPAETTEVELGWAGQRIRLSVNSSEPAAPPAIKLAEPSSSILAVASQGESFLLHPLWPSPEISVDGGPSVRVPYVGWEVRGSRKLTFAGRKCEFTTNPSPRREMTLFECAR